MLRRCSHGVFLSEDFVDGQNPYCSGCTRPRKPRLRSLRREREADELKIRECPLCFSKEFKYINNECYSCPRCGFDETSV